MQLNLFERKTQIRQPGRIIPKYKFDRSPSPIGLPDFCRDMLLVDRDDHIVFKTCDCGAVYAFNSMFAYESLVVCYGCQRKMFAREMNWSLSKKTIDGEYIMDWETAQLYRFGEGESFGATLAAEQSNGKDHKERGEKLTV